MTRPPTSAKTLGPCDGIGPATGDERRWILPNYNAQGTEYRGLVVRKFQQLRGENSSKKQIGAAPLVCAESNLGLHNGTAAIATTSVTIATVWGAYTIQCWRCSWRSPWAHAWHPTTISPRGLLNAPLASQTTQSPPGHRINTIKHRSPASSPCSTMKSFGSSSITATAPSAQKP